LQLTAGDGMARNIEGGRRRQEAADGFRRRPDKPAALCRLLPPPGYLLGMLLFAAAAFVAAIVLLVAGVDPVPTWFYVFAWYPTLVLLDEAAHRLDGRPLVL